MDTVIFRIKETGYTYRYDRYNSLEIVATNYQIQTNIDSQRTAADCMDGLLCCIDKIIEGQGMTISFNEKTRCYDAVISLDEMLPEWLLFDQQQILNVRKMNWEQRQQLIKTAEKRGREEMERYLNNT